MMNEEMNSTPVTQEKTAPEMPAVPFPAEEPAAAPLPPSGAPGPAPLPAEGPAIPPAEEPVLPPEGGPGVPPSDIPPAHAGEMPGEPKEQKSGRLKKILTIAAAAAITALTAFLIITIIGARPMNLLRTGIKNSRKALESSAPVQYAQAIAEEGSIELKVDLSKLGSALGADLDAELSLKTYLHLQKKPAAALELSSTLDGKEFLSGLLYADQDDLVLQSSQLLGKTNYGVSLKNLQKNLKGSVLDPDQNTPYSLDEETFEALLEQEDPTEQLEEYTEELEEISKELVKALLVSLKENAKPAKSRETLEIGGESVKTTAISFELDEKQLVAVYSDLIAWARGSEKLSSLLHQMLTDNASLVEEQGVTAAELEEQFTALLTDLADGAAALEETLAGTELSCTFYVNRSNKQLISLELAALFMEQRYGLTLTAGPDLKAAESVMAIVKSGDLRYTAVYNVEENSSEEFSARLKLKQGTTLLSTLELEWDKEEGDFTLETSDSFTLTGSLTQKKKVSTLSLKKLSLNSPALSTLLGTEFSVKDLGITLTLSMDDDVPGQPKYTDLLTMKEQSVDSLAEELTENFTELFSDLGIA